MILPQPSLHIQETNNNIIKSPSFSSSSSFLFFSITSLMELEKPWVTELHVRMDCNGCVQKIKRAVHGIEGVYDTYIDFPQQKLTVVGRANPEKILKAIKKTRKIATLCSHKETGTDAANPDPPPSEPAPETTEPPPANPPPAAEPAPPAEEPVKEDPPPAEEAAPAPEEKPSSEQPSDHHPDTTSEAKDVGVIPMIHYYPHNYGIRDHHHLSYNYGVRQYEDPNYYSTTTSTHSYNTYRPSPHISEYGNIRSSSPQTSFNDGIHYAQEHYSSEDYHYHERGGSSNNNNNNNITSMFSDENPNACTIV